MRYEYIRTVPVSHLVRGGTYVGQKLSLSDTFHSERKTQSVLFRCSKINRLHVNSMNAIMSVQRVSPNNRRDQIVSAPSMLRINPISAALRLTHMHRRITYIHIQLIYTLNIQCCGSYLPCADTAIRKTANRSFLLSVSVENIFDAGLSLCFLNLIYLSP